MLSVAILGTRHVSDVSFKVIRGELIGLVGLRGAGHEDVGRALFGLEKHDGQVLLDGAAPDLRNARTAMKSGIGFVARDRVVESIAPSLTIRENTFINPEATGRGLFSFMSG